MKHLQQNLFAENSLPIEVNGVRAVNSVDLYDLTIPFDSTPGKFIHLNNYFIFTFIKDFVDFDQESQSIHWYIWNLPVLFVLNPLL